MTTTGAEQSARPHIAARVDYAISRLQSLFFRRRGWQPRIVPHTGYGSTSWVRILGRVLLAPPLRDVPLDPPTTATRQQNTRGWRRFLTTPMEGVEVDVEVDGEQYRLRTDRGGYLDAVLPVRLSPGWHELALRTRNGRPTVTRIFVTGDDQRLGIVSDIDDTAMVTLLPRPLIAAWNTFVLRESARAAVPGMAEFYRGLLERHPGAPVIYLSTGAWNVAPTLTRFLSRNGFPEGPLLLTDWGPTNTGWFRSGREHKHLALRRLAIELPDVRWLLVGDDGQHDPQIYAEFARDEPDHVAAIAIRQLTVAQQVLSGGTPDGDSRQVPSTIATVAAPDGYGLAGALRLE
jgi:phosphatidate phosphatase APP1